LNSGILESYTQKGGYWYDFVGIFIKNMEHVNFFKNRILDLKEDFENGQIYGSKELLNFCEVCQDHKKLSTISQIIDE